MDAPRAARGILASVLLSSVIVGVQVEISRADWTQTSGPKGGSVRAFLAVPNGSSGTSLYTGGTRIWRTDDQGAHWTSLQNGLTDPNAFTFVAVPNGASGQTLYVGTGQGVFKSSDGGASWSPSSQGLPVNTSTYALASGSNGAGGTNLYAGAGVFDGRVFRSADNGASWTSTSSGLPVGQASVNVLTTTSAGTVLAGMNGIYRSTNFGASWTRVLDRSAFSFAKNGSTIYAGTSSGVWRSTNDGATWTAINNGMNFTWVYGVAAIPNGTGVTLFATAGGVMRSTDNGATWQAVNDGITNLSVFALTTAPNPGGGTDLYAGTSEGVFRTTNNGASWTDVSFIVSFPQALEVTPSGAVLAGTDLHIFRSTDAGANWAKKPVASPILDFAIQPNGAGGASLFACGASFGLLKSTDDGNTWAGIAIDDIEVNSITVVANGTGGTNLIAGAYSGMFVSSDGGASWLHPEPSFMALDYVVTPNGSGGNDIFAGGFNGVWRSTNAGLTWTHLALGEVVQGMATTGNGARLFAGGDPFGVYRSTDHGATWTLSNTGLSDLRISALLSPDGVNLFAAGAGGVFLSSDDGAHWTNVGAGLTTGVSSLALSADGATLFAGSTGAGVWKRPLAELLQGVPPPPPPPAPAIASFTPASGPVGTEVTITGSNFAGASAVRFNNTPAASFAVVSSTQIRATVAAGATTGSISITTAGGTATSSGVFSVTAPPAPTTLTFTPSHDAWVNAKSPSSNNGSTAELRIRGGSQTNRAYLKFDVSGVTSAIESATLRLRVIDAGPDGGSVFKGSNTFAGTSTPWTESALTWSNAPAPSGSALDVAGPVSLNAWVDFDVTSAVTGNGTFSFVLTSTSNNAVDYGSSESGNPPRLVVVTSGSAAQIALDDQVGETPIVEVTRLALHANHPNPFVSETTIQYSLPRATAVRLVIYDVRGRTVRTLVDGVQEAGDRRTVWDGRDDRGFLAGAGLYLCRLEADGTSLIRKLSRMK
jgi:photosystem II stability/assembly factor-like uncharacterized protein